MDVALVTGSSTGIGESTALHLARNNFHVFATMRNPDAGTALLEAAKSEGLRLEVLALDVNDADSCSNCVGEIVNRADQIDILVSPMAELKMLPGRKQDSQIEKYGKLMSVS